MKYKIAVALNLALLAIGSRKIIIPGDRVRPLSSPGSYLFVWAGELNAAFLMQQAEGARRGRDFLAVFDVTPRPNRSGRLITMFPV